MTDKCETVESSVIFRSGPITERDYDEAIQMLQDAKAQQTGYCCACCGDSGHFADICHHNPLVVARYWVRATSVWRCYHCNFIATNDDEARRHFGLTDQDIPTCHGTGKQTKEADDAKI